MIENTGLAIVYALLGGFIPAAIWLGFWLSEDSEHPEPPRRIMYTFGAGFVAVIASLALEYITNKWIDHGAPMYSLLIVFLWAAFEEITKFLGAWWVALRSSDTDEPIDPLVYMITVAIGFATLENILFILPSFFESGIYAGAVNAAIRFVGATLLHIVASGTLGVYMSYTFYSSQKNKKIFFCIGLMLAICLHTIFNLVIIHDEAHSIPAFALVWLTALVLIYLFEKIKIIHRS